MSLRASEAYIKKIREFHHGKLIKVLPELAASRRIVNRFRKKYAKIVELWDDELADALTAVMEQADANNPWQLLKYRGASVADPHPAERETALPGSESHNSAGPT